MSKGSTSRQFSVTNEEYANRWNAIFGKDNDSQKNEEKALEFDRFIDPCNSGGSNHTQSDTGQAQIS